jgi:GT2 family glycosyltransferase
MNTKFRFVCATREPQHRFADHTALGRSLAPFRQMRFVELKLYAENRAGLPSLYNEAIREAASDPAILIFVHDDVYLCDWFWPLHILTGLRVFDVIGLAGNKRRVPGQSSWCFIDDRLTPDSAENLSGFVAHGNDFPPDEINVFGLPRQQVKLLDGLLLAAASDTLVRSGLTFDERFDFHFYDMDFCRQAELKQLRLGTWTVSVIHQSGGGFDSPSWRAGYARYLEKWQA